MEIMDYLAGTLYRARLRDRLHEMQEYIIIPSVPVSIPVAELKGGKDMLVYVEETPDGRLFILMPVMSCLKTEDIPKVLLADAFTNAMKERARDTLLP